MKKNSVTNEFLEETWNFLRSLPKDNAVLPAIAFYSGMSITLQAIIKSADLEEDEAHLVYEEIHTQLLQFEQYLKFAEMSKNAQN